MATLVFFINLLLLALTIINYFSIRHPRLSTESNVAVDVLIPVRNEEANIIELVNCFKSQIGLPNINFYFLDDASTDNTEALIRGQSADDKRFHLISVPALPRGWIGKTWALQQGFLVACGEITITIDADVRLEKDALIKSVNLLQSSGLTFISPYPKQIAGTLSERLIQPLLQWSWMSTVPLAVAEKSSRTSLVVANGQFFLVKRENLQAINGFQSNAAKVLDDIELARALIKSGAKGAVVNGSAIATTRMYTSFKELRAGYGKSLWQAFGGKVGTALAITFLAITGIYPFLLFIDLHPLGLFALEFVIASRLVAAKIFRGSYLDAFLHPFSSALLIYLILYSCLNKNTAQWKGRKV
jgi:cellulose synthase/poly-beta-1,6-N-acetylglucosamine synthase-like glycosyltransferase